jgi:hypothetical protein
MFIHCMPKYLALIFHWNENKLKSWLQNCIINFYKFENWKFITKLYLVKNDLIIYF